MSWLEDMILKSASYKKPKYQIDLDKAIWPRDINAVANWMVRRYQFRDALLNRYGPGTSRKAIIDELGEPNAHLIASQAFPGYNEKFGFDESEEVLFYSIWIGHDMQLEQIGFVLNRDDNLDRVELFRS